MNKINPCSARRRSSPQCCIAGRRDRGIAARRHRPRASVFQYGTHSDDGWRRTAFAYTHGDRHITLSARQPEGTSCDATFE